MHIVTVQKKYAERIDFDFEFIVSRCLSINESSVVAHHIYYCISCSSTIFIMYERRCNIDKVHGLLQDKMPCFKILQLY